VCEVSLDALLRGGGGGGGGDDDVPAELAAALRAATLLKMDVQGHELKALVGMRALLRARGVKQIFVEVMPAVIAKKGGDPMQIVDELAAFRIGWQDGKPLTRELWQRRLDEWRDVIAAGHSPWLDLHGTVKKEGGDAAPQ
jgi:hypothetical protein